MHKWSRVCFHISVNFLQALALHKRMNSRLAFPHEHLAQFPLQVHLTSSLVHLAASGKVIQTGIQFSPSLFHQKSNGNGILGFDEDTIQVVAVGKHGNYFWTHVFCKQVIDASLLCYKRLCSSVGIQMCCITFYLILGKVMVLSHIATNCDSFISPVWKKARFTF